MNGIGIDNAHMAFDSDCFSQAIASTRRNFPDWTRLAANPMFVAGLERIGFAAQHIWNGSAELVLAHATSGPALQQNLVAVMEGKN